MANFFFKKRKTKTLYNFKKLSCSLLPFSLLQDKNISEKCQKENKVITHNSSIFYFQLLQPYKASKGSFLCCNIQSTQYHVLNYLMFIGSLQQWKIMLSDRTASGLTHCYHNINIYKTESQRILPSPLTPWSL